MNQDNIPISSVALLKSLSHQGLNFLKCENSEVRPKSYYGGLVQKWPPICFSTPVSMSLGTFSYIDFEFNHVLCFGWWDSGKCDTSRFEQCLHIWACPFLLYLEPWHVNKPKLDYWRIRDMSAATLTLSDQLLTNCKHMGEPKWDQPSPAQIRTFQQNSG